MKKLRNLLGAFILAVSFIGCPNIIVPYSKDSNQKENLPDEYSFANPSELTVETGGIKPAGISQYLSSNSRGLSIKDGQLIFAQKPKYRSDLTGFITPPKISKCPVTTPRTIESIFDFNAEEISNFILKEYNQITGDGNLIPKELNLETLILPDSSVLVSSNISKKIYQYGTSLTPFLEDEKLRGITDMAFDEDSGNIYLVKSSVNGQPPKLVSIDSGKNILEYPIDLASLKPSRINVAGLSYTSDGINMELGRKLSIVKNSSQGFSESGNKFYISDYLNEIIYAVDTNNNISVFKEDVGHPTSLAVSERGDLFIALGPEVGFVNGSYPAIAKYSRIDRVNYLTKEITNFYTFSDDTLDEFQTGDAGYPSNGKNGYPVGFEISMCLEETVPKLTLHLTNSFAGTIKDITVDKDY